MSSLRVILVNALWLVSDRVFRLVINFLVGILIARHLGPAYFGVLNYGQVMLLLFTPLATFGLPDITVRELSSSKLDPDRVVATVLGVRLILGALSLLAVTIVALLGRGGNMTAVLVIVAFGASFLPQSFDVIESRFQSLNAVGVISVARMVNTVLFALLRIVALLASAGVLWFAILTTLEIASFALFTLHAAAQRGIALRFRAFYWPEGRKLLKQATPLMLRQVAVSIYMRIDQLMIQHFMGDAALGVYSVSVRLSELWYFVPGAIMTGAAPTLTRSYEMGLDAYRRELSRVVRLIVPLAVAAAAILSFGAHWIIPLLFGAKYAAAAQVLQIQAWAGVFLAIGVGVQQWFLNTGNLRLGLYQACAGAIVGTVLNALLIPRLGLTGAALSQVGSYAFSMVIMNAIVPATRDLFRIQMRAFLLR
jgi:PST family polysaccharide transporter